VCAGGAVTASHVSEKEADVQRACFRKEGRQSQKPGEFDAPYAKSQAGSVFAEQHAPHSFSQAPKKAKTELTPGIKTEKPE